MQDLVVKEMAFHQIELDALIKARNAGLESTQKNQKIADCKEQLKNLTDKLKKLQSNKKRQQVFKDSRKRALEEECVTNSTLAKRLKLQDSPGQPCKNTEQPELLRAITDIVMLGAGADGKRRCEALRSCMTLDELHSQILKQGFSISRTALYYRILPSNVATKDGNRHVTTVPVRLVRPQNNLHKAQISSKDHSDSWYNKHVKESQYLLQVFTFI